MKSRDGHLAARASAAFEPMGFLVGCLLADAGQTGYPMTGAEQEKYLASVEENLRALVGRTPPNSELFDQAVRALNAIGALIECFQPVPDREPGE